jgi:SAM-dependent methyltransferase
MLQESLDVRVREPEIMDRLDLDPREHHAALVGLKRLNAVAMASRLVFEPIATWARGSRRPLRVLDVGCGGGDTLVSLAQRARRAALPLELFGCDRSPLAIEAARAHARAHDVAIEFAACDVSIPRDDPHADRLPFRPDVAINTLFLHHLDEEQAVRLLAELRDVARAVVIVDLLRTRLGMWLAIAASRLLTRSTVVQRDAVTSVRAAWSLVEIERLAARAGLQGARLERVWPERFRLTWSAD